MEELLEAGARQKKKYLQSCVGKCFTLVPERFENGYTEGYLENYARAYLQGEIGKEPIQVRVEGLFQDGVLAVTIDENQEK